MQEQRIKSLLDLEKTLKFLLDSKRDHLSEIEAEIMKLESSLDIVHLLISSNSFQSANELIDTESFLKKHDNISLNNVETVRKIYSPEETLLITCIYRDNSINIRINSPEKLGFTQEVYIQQFVKSTLVSLKSIEPKIQPQIFKTQINQVEYVESIEILNISHFESFETILEQMQKIASKKS